MRILFALKGRVERGGEEVGCGICCCLMKGASENEESLGSQLCKGLIKRIFVGHSQISQHFSLDVLKLFYELSGLWKNNSMHLSGEA